MSFADFQESFRAWIDEEDLKYTALHDPSVPFPSRLGILVDAREADERAVCLTVASILSGTAQRSLIQIVFPGWSKSRAVKEWLSNEETVVLIEDFGLVDVDNDLLLVCRAGTVFGRYSVEAAVESKQVSGCEVLRSFVDGAPGTLELWTTVLLLDIGSRSRAEAEVRERGGERWVSGASLGIRYMGRPRAKQYLRKGVAAALEQVVLVHDLNEGQTRVDYQKQVRELQEELQRLKRRQWRLALSGTRDGVLTVPLRALRKGPRYVAQRIERRIYRHLGGS